MYHKTRCRDPVFPKPCQLFQGPLSATEDENKKVFAELYDLGQEYKNYFVAEPKLSMGMSADFKEAIICGSNLVRVGSAIMGDRVYETN